MRLFAKQLEQHLKKNFHPIYFIYGADLYQHLDAQQHIRKKAQELGFTERLLRENCAEHWENIDNDLQSQSLFSSKQCIEYKLGDGKLSKTATTALHKILDNPPPNKMFLFLAYNLESQTKRSAWFTALENKAVCILAAPFNSSDTQNWLQNKLLRKNLTLEPEAQEYLLSKTEGNLFALAQAIEKLDLAYLSHTNRNTQIIKKSEIEHIIWNQSHYTVYDLMEVLLAGHAKRSIEIFTQLRELGVEPLLILWACTQSLRKLSALAVLKKTRSLKQEDFKNHHIFKHQIQPFSLMLERFHLHHFYDFLIEAQEVDKHLKTTTGYDSHLALFTFICRLAGTASYGL